MVVITGPPQGARAHPARAPDSMPIPSRCEKYHRSTRGFSDSMPRWWLLSAMVSVSSRAFRHVLKETARNDFLVVNTNAPPDATFWSITRSSFVLRSARIHANGVTCGHGDAKVRLCRIAPHVRRWMISADGWRKLN